MNLRTIQSNLNCITRTSCCTRVYTYSNVKCLNCEVQEYFCPKHLVYFNSSFQCSIRRVADEHLFIFNILWTNTKGNCLIFISIINQLLSFILRKFNGVRTKHQTYFRTGYNYFCIDEVHLRRTDKSGNKQVVWSHIQIKWRINLLHNTIFHNNDSGTKCHSLGLVMCYVDDGSAQSLMQFGNLGTHLYTKFCIQV